MCSNIPPGSCDRNFIFSRSAVKIKGKNGPSQYGHHLGYLTLFSTKYCSDSNEGLNYNITEICTLLIKIPTTQYMVVRTIILYRSILNILKNSHSSCKKGCGQVWQPYTRWPGWKSCEIQVVAKKWLWWSIYGKIF